MILNHKRSNCGNSQDSKVDSHRMRHCSTREPKMFGELLKLSLGMVEQISDMTVQGWTCEVDTPTFKSIRESRLMCVIVQNILPQVLRVVPYICEVVKDALRFLVWNARGC